MADQVPIGVCVHTDMMVKDGLINLDFAGPRCNAEMGKEMMGTRRHRGGKAPRLRSAEVRSPIRLSTSVDARARGVVDLDHGRQGPDALRVDEAATHGSDSRGGGIGCQHHRRGQ